MRQRRGRQPRLRAVRRQRDHGRPTAWYTTGSYSDPAWLTISKAKVGLGSVENTALSTWAGSANITTLGTIASGTVPWARLSGAAGNLRTVRALARHWRPVHGGRLVEQDHQRHVLDQHHAAARRRAATSHQRRGRALGARTATCPATPSQGQGRPGQRDTAPCCSTWVAPRTSPRWAPSPAAVQLRRRLSGVPRQLQRRRASHGSADLSTRWADRLEQHHRRRVRHQRDGQRGQHRQRERGSLAGRPAASWQRDRRRSRRAGVLGSYGRHVISSSGSTDDWVNDATAAPTGVPAVPVGWNGRLRLRRQRDVLDYADSAGSATSATAARRAQPTPATPTRWTACTSTPGRTTRPTRSSAPMGTGTSTPGTSTATTGLTAALRRTSCTTTATTICGTPRRTPLRKPCSTRARWTPVGCGRTITLPCRLSTLQWGVFTPRAAQATIASVVCWADTGDAVIQLRRNDGGDMINGNLACNGSATTNLNGYRRHSRLGTTWACGPSPARRKASGSRLLTRWLTNEHEHLLLFLAVLLAAPCWAATANFGPTGTSCYCSRRRRLPRRTHLRDGLPAR